MRAAVFSYNHADWYVEQVMTIAASCAAADTSIPTGTHALPVARDWFMQHPSWLTLPHHDDPAIDIPVPVATTAFAASSRAVVLTGAAVGSCGGTVIVDGDDGARYTCGHLSAVIATTGHRVLANQSAPAAARPAPQVPATAPARTCTSASPSKTCPGDPAALTAWANGTTYDPTAAPTSGCTS